MGAEQVKIEPHGAGGVVYPQNGISFDVKNPPQHSEQTGQANLRFAAVLGEHTLEHRSLSFAQREQDASDRFWIGRIAANAGMTCHELVQQVVVL